MTCAHQHTHRLPYCYHCGEPNAEQADLESWHKPPPPEGVKPTGRSLSGIVAEIGEEIGVFPPKPGLRTGDPHWVKAERLKAQRLASLDRAIRDIARELR